jgi:hypothetical protein
LAAALTDETGTGANVFATSPTLVTPILGTPTSGTLTNCTGLPISTGVSGLASNVATFLATPSSANLAAALTDETGTGAAVFATSPTLVTPALGTPASGTLTNCTGLPAASVVAGTFGAGAFTFPSTLAVTGVLTVSGFGTHAFSAGGTGTNRLSIRNTLAGSANLAQLAVVDDTGYDTSLTRFASTYTSSGPNQANGTTLLSEGPGGLSIQTSHASGEIRFYSGGSTERARFTSGGAFSIGGDLTFADAIAGVNTTGNISTTHLMALKATTNGTGGTYLVFENAAGSVVGKIYQATTTTTAYVTSSDARLKTDLGVADDLSALRALRIHDFAWKDNGVVGRNVFAQEALMVSPRGVKPGDDSRTATGELANPWMFDRLEYVPDLIVGWQQHEARLAALEARLKEQ